MVKIALDPAMYHAQLTVAEELRKAAAAPGAAPETSEPGAGPLLPRLPLPAHLKDRSSR